jgi:hypothetical protein
MTFPFKYLFIFCTLLTVTACATLDEGECLSANWYEIGYQDGSKGYNPERYQKHNEACQEHNVRVNTADYHNGWGEGITQYCTEDNGWGEGLAGETYHKSCPIHLELEFFNAYQLGRGIYDKQQRLEDINDKLERIADKLANDDTTSEHRKILRKERNRLKSDSFTAESELDHAVLEARDMGFYSR